MTSLSFACRLPYVLVVSLMLSLHAAGAEDVNKDFQFVLESLDGQQTYSGIPPTFPRFEIPPPFIVSEGGGQSGIQWLKLETGLSPEDAIFLLSESIISAGFSDFRSLAGRALNEFITSEETRSQRTFCRDDFAYLSLRATVGVGLNDVLVSNIGGQSLPDFSSCQEEADRQRTPGFSLHGAELKEMMQFAPVLDLPRSATMIRPPVIGNTSDSPDVYETFAEFVSDMNGAQIFQLLARQIESQEWSLGSESKDNLSGKGSWFRDVDNKYSLSADVNIVELAAARFSIRMRIEKFPFEP